MSWSLYCSARRLRDKMLEEQRRLNRTCKLFKCAYSRLSDSQLDDLAEHFEVSRDTLPRQGDFKGIERFISQLLDKDKEVKQ